MGTGKIDILAQTDANADGVTLAIVEHLHRPITPAEWSDMKAAAATSQAALDSYMGAEFPWYSGWGSDKRGYLRSALLAL